MFHLIFSPSDFQWNKFEKYNFLGNIEFEFWDLPLHPFFGNKEQNQLFQKVDIVVYVFDAFDLRDKSSQFDYFERFLSQTQFLEKKSKFFVFIHKMDKLKDEKRQETLEISKKKIINIAKGGIDKIFETSIFDFSFFQVHKIKLKSINFAFFFQKGLV